MKTIVEHEASIIRWTTLVSEGEKRMLFEEIGHNILLRPKWSIADYDNYLDARQLYPFSDSSKVYHRAHEMGISVQSMVEISRAVLRGSQSDLLAAVESGLPGEYLRVLNQSWRAGRDDRYMMPVYPVSLSRTLYNAGVPAEYAAALINDDRMLTHRIIAFYRAGVLPEYAAALD